MRRLAMSLRLGPRSGAALAGLAAGLALAAPAHAGNVTVQAWPADGDAEPVRGEDSVASAVVHFPRGRVDPYGALGAYWAGRRPSGAPTDCEPRAIASAAAMVAPLSAAREFQPKTVHRTETTVTLTGGGLAAALPVAAERVVGRANDPRVLAGWVHLTLPQDVLPLYPRREIYIRAFDFTGLQLSHGCGAAQRRGEAAARAALRGVSVALRPSYSPPPPPLDPPTIDLAAGGGLQLNGIKPREETGATVAAAGDVNGDGRADAVVSTPYAGRAGRPNAGAAFVVFGRPASGTLALAALAPAGFRIDGPVAGGFELPAAGVGDMDGDGLAEIAVGAPRAGRRQDGTVYILRGKRDGATVDLAKREDVLFAIHGGNRCPIRYVSRGAGAQVASAGDANGDGIGDVAVLVADDCGDRRAAGGVYIVFGKRHGGDIDLRRLGTAGIAARGSGDSELANAQVAGAGDTNGDGLADVVAGNIGPEGSPSYAAVLPGARVGAAGTLSTLAGSITSKMCAGVAEPVAGPGDVNGDGFADIAVGAPGGCGNSFGRAFVVFGGPSLGRVDLDRLGSGGFTIEGTSTFNPGRTLAAAGDMNGDGLADLALGDLYYGAPGRRFGGAVMLVHGRRGTDTVRLASLGPDGFRWLGAGRLSHLGESLAGVGDFDGDGRPDLLAGAPRRASYTGGAWILPQP